MIENTRIVLLLNCESSWSRDDMHRAFHEKIASSGDALGNRNYYFNIARKSADSNGGNEERCGELVFAVGRREAIQTASVRGRGKGCDGYITVDFVGDEF